MVRKAGRKGSPTDRARELIALVGALDDAGDSISAPVVAARLGIPENRALEIINLIVTASGESGNYLTLSLTDSEDEVTLAESSHATRGKPVRLTGIETTALMAALDELGVAADDPLRMALDQGFSSHIAERSEVIQTLSAPRTAETAHALDIISHAIINGTTLHFDYQGTQDTAPVTRHVTPASLSRNRGQWYLSAYDLDRNDDRIFRLDRMATVTPGEPAPAISKRAKGKPDTAQIVTVTFDDPTYLDMFDWGNVTVVARSDTSVTVQMPWYGGTWLVRHLAACANHIRVHTPTLAHAIHLWATQLISE